MTSRPPFWCPKVNLLVNLSSGFELRIACVANVPVRTHFDFQLPHSVSWPLGGSGERSREGLQADPTILKNAHRFFSTIDLMRALIDSFNRFLKSLHANCMRCRQSRKIRNLATHKLVEGSIGSQAGACKTPRKQNIIASKRLLEKLT